MKKYYVAVAALALAFSVIAAEKVDPRTRTFIDPVRVVWATPKDKDWSGRFAISGTDRLGDTRWGQAPEYGWSRKEGLTLENTGNSAAVILDFGRELHGGINLQVAAGSTRNCRVRVRFGESVSETLTDALAGERGATNDHAIRDTVLTLPVMGSIEYGNTGFRFVRIDLLTSGKVILEAVRAVSLMRPMARLGGFRSSDERLNRIWETAAYTAHLCCQDYLWDGIKRDRLVWMGDMHPETMTILGVFGDASVLPESLDYIAGTTDPDKWINNIPTYSLWWIRNLAEWYRFTGDLEYVKKHADYLKRTFEHVATSMNAEGMWKPDFPMWNFLDWPTKANNPAQTAGTQGLSLITARETKMLADALGDAALSAKAEKVAEALSKLKPEPHGAKSAAALLALSGLRTPAEMFAEELGKDGNARVSTFYGYYMLEAMSAAGENRRALDTVRDYWGGMIDVGATSFWEDFDLAWTNNCYRVDEMPVAGKKDIHGDYGNYCYCGFRHSLCHGWSSGPAAWLINNVLGIRPLTVGCTKVEVKPFLGDLEWAEGAMALPRGRCVKVRAEKRADGTLEVKVDAPDDVTVVR